MVDDIHEREAQRGAIIAFRAPPELVADLEAAAAAEGISRSDVARRACIRDARTYTAAGNLKVPA